MNNNGLLRQLSYALDLGNPVMIDIFRQSGCAMNESTLVMLLKGEAEEGFIPCSNPLLAFFMDGLIVHKRGRRESSVGEVPKPTISMDNNSILKKLRIALDLKEEDMLAIFKLAAVAISKAELGALFRATGNKNYKPCSDQLMYSFLQGLSLRDRGATAEQNAV